MNSRIRKCTCKVRRPAWNAVVAFVIGVTVLGYSGAGKKKKDIEQLLRDNKQWWRAIPQLMLLKEDVSCVAIVRSALEGSTLSTVQKEKIIGVLSRVLQASSNESVARKGNQLLVEVIGRESQKEEVGVFAIQALRKDYLPNKELGKILDQEVSANKNMRLVSALCRIIQPDSVASETKSILVNRSKNLLKKLSFDDIEVLRGVLVLLRKCSAKKTKAMLLESLVEHTISPLKARAVWDLMTNTEKDSGRFLFTQSLAFWLSGNKVTYPPQIRELGKGYETLVLTILIGKLESKNAHVRLDGVIALRQIFRKNYGFNPADEREIRSRSVEHWKEFLREFKGGRMRRQVRHKN